MLEVRSVFAFALAAGESTTGSLELYRTAIGMLVAQFARTASVDVPWW
ncbi:hypothetical protein [Rhodococcus sp. NBC_00297]|nr:hypothetical protein [Rhodococcus sp. NBC_00297]